MHFVSVVNFRNRAAATCTCGDLNTPERFGKDAAAQANHDGRIHYQEIEAASQERERKLQAWLNPGWGMVDDSGVEVPVVIEDDYHVFAPCPECEEGMLDCGSGLDFENLVVACNMCDHEFAGYYQGEEFATFFWSSGTDNGPFDTTQ